MQSGRRGWRAPAGTAGVCDSTGAFRLEPVGSASDAAAAAVDESEDGWAPLSKQSLSNTLRELAATSEAAGFGVSVDRWQGGVDYYSVTSFRDVVVAIRGARRQGIKTALTRSRRAQRVAVSKKRHATRAKTK